MPLIARMRTERCMVSSGARRSASAAGPAAGTSSNDRSLLVVRSPISTRFASTPAISAVIGAEEG